MESKTVHQHNQGASHKKPVQEYPQEMRQIAKGLYWQGWRVSDIANHLLVPRTTVHSWKNGEKWDRAEPVDKVETTTEARLIQLIQKEGKSNADYKEMDSLAGIMERMARVKHYQGSGKASDLNPEINARNEAPRKKRRNHLSDQQIELLKQDFFESIFPFQLHWYQNKDHRNRFILKSRQIGATWYFSREALMDALETGRNQIFVSASKRQALLFRAYIVSWVSKVTGVSLTGEEIVLANGAKLIFLGTNSKTSQGDTGNLYMDEAFWIPRFAEFNKVLRAVATHKHLRRTYISTPSTDGHEAYPLWTGEASNKGRKEKRHIDLSNHVLKEGSLGADRIWRNKVTLEDAIAQGFNLVDVEELRDETSPDEFANLYGCEFIKESESAFKFSELQECMVDSTICWPDYKEFYERPFSNKPVYLGHDPSATGDKASLAIVAPPEQERDLFRVLKRTSFMGASFEAQAASIIAATKTFHAKYIDIDAGGIGLAVHELVAKERPDAKGILYNPDVKMMMVLKAQSLMRNKRLQFDLEDTELLRSFLAIKPTLTHSQRKITFDAGRNKETGHADAAWSVMHTLIHEPLDGNSISGQKSMMVVGGSLH